MHKPRVIFGFMPPSDKPTKEKSVQQVVEDVGLYPPEAYAFIQKGLNFTVERLHGKQKDGRQKDPTVSRHVTGQDSVRGAA